MESWRWVFRNGFAPLLPTAGLEAVKRAIKRDDPRLLQGATVAPIALQANKQRRIEGACALGISMQHGEDLRTVGELERHFGDLCTDVDERLGEPAACRWFLAWYDDAPRDVMRQELLVEVDRELRGRIPLAALSEPGVLAA